MSWVTDIERAEELLLQAGTCRIIDSRRVATSMQCLSFDDMATFTKVFGTLVHRLMQLSSDELCHYVVLDPHPKQFFLRFYDKYPVIEIRSSDTPEQYAASFNNNPGRNPGDALNTLCYEWVIVPQSHSWFIHCMRSSEDSSGHLWLLQQWIEDAQKAYEAFTVSGRTSSQHRHHVA